jgi:CheY-like chemotaxis protein
MTSILLVDDERDAADTTAVLLRGCAYDVRCAYSARQALDALDERPDFDIVVSDIRMPEVDGFDFLRVLRHRFPKLPIVLITGKPLVDEESIPQGAVIVTKPFSIDRLQEAISERLVADR